MCTSNIIAVVCTCVLNLRCCALQKDLELQQLQGEIIKEEELGQLKPRNGSDGDSGVQVWLINLCWHALCRYIEAFLGVPKHIHTYVGSYVLHTLHTLTALIV